MRYTEARAILSEAIEQLDELTDAEMAKLEKEHEARMAEQERTAYMSPKMRYHVDLLRKLRLAKKPRRKKVNEEEQLDEKKLFDPVFGHAGIDNNPKARKFNPKTARPNKVKKRNLEMRVGRAGYGLSNPESRSVNDGRYTLRQRIKEATEQLDEGRKTFAQRSASLIGRMGGSPEEVRQGITGKRTPAAKSGRALLTKAQKAAERKRERDPDYPYGKAESRRMSKYMSESELDEATRKKPSKSSKPKKVKKVVGERPDQTDWNAVNAYQRKLHASHGIRGLAPTPWSPQR